MKRILKADRLRLRGMSGAQDQFLLTATAQFPSMSVATKHGIPSALTTTAGGHAAVICISFRLLPD